MVRRLSVALLPALVAGCAASSSGSEERAPLEGRIFPSQASSLTISLNQPAHVAVFDIAPGQGVGLLYPSAEGQRAEFDAGYSHLTNLRATRYHYYFTPTSFVSNTATTVGAGQPRFLMMVASREPLNVEGLQRSPGSMRRFLGMPAYTSINPHRVMDQLVARVVPPQEDDDWAVTYWVSWPADYRIESDGRIIQVTCDDGSIDLVPVEFVAIACKGGRGIRPVPGKPGAPPQPETTDTTAAPAAQPRSTNRLAVDVQPEDKSAPPGTRIGPTPQSFGEAGFRRRVVEAWEQEAQSRPGGHRITEDRDRRGFGRSEAQPRSHPGTGSQPSSSSGGPRAEPPTSPTGGHVERPTNAGRGAGGLRPVGGN